MQPLLVMNIFFYWLQLILYKQHKLNVSQSFLINSELNVVFVGILKLRREFSNEVESVSAALRGLSATASSSGHADLTALFRVANHEAKKSRAQNRIFRVVTKNCLEFYIFPSHLLLPNYELRTNWIVYWMSICFVNVIF